MIVIFKGIINYLVIIFHYRSLHIHKFQIIEFIILYYKEFFYDYLLLLIVLFLNYI